MLEHCWCIKVAGAKISSLSLSKNVVIKLQGGFMEKKIGFLESKRLFRMLQIIPLHMGRLGSTEGKIIKFLRFEICRI